MNPKFGLYLTYAIYLFTIISLLIVSLYPRFAVAEAVPYVEPAKSYQEEKTIETEIDRLSLLYGVSSSTVRAVAKCESSMYGSAINRNKLPDGTVWSSDFGPLQINDYFHKKTMDSLGLNIYNEFDSLEYGIRMMSQQGLAPWSASRGCWNKLI